MLLLIGHYLLLEKPGVFAYIISRKQNKMFFYYIEDHMQKIWGTFAKEFFHLNCHLECFYTHPFSVNNCLII